MSALILVLRAATWTTVAFALWKGDLATRIAAATYGVLEIATMIIRPQVGVDASGETILLAADFICAVVFLLLAVRYANLWLGAAMLFQAAQFSLHAWYLVNELPHDVMHAWINNTDDWGILIAMFVGAVLSIRRRIGFRREDAEREAREAARRTRTLVAA
jgi:hypothetical protein